MIRRFVIGLVLASMSVLLSGVSASADGWPPFP